MQKTFKVEETPNCFDIKAIKYDQTQREFKIKPETRIVPETTRYKVKDREYKVKEFSIESKDEGILLNIAKESRLLSQQEFVFDTLNAFLTILEPPEQNPDDFLKSMTALLKHEMQVKRLIDEVHANPLIDNSCRSKNRGEFELLRFKAKEIKED